MNVRRPLLSAVAAGAAAFSLLTTAGCVAGDAAGSDGRVDVFTTLYPLQYVAERVGGPEVRVVSVAKPGQEPHNLDLSARQVGELSDADLLVYLKGLQPLVDEAVQQAGVDHVAEVTSYTELAEGEEHEDDGHGHGDEGDAEDEHGHDHDHGDPHIWLDPTRLALVAAGVRDELVEVDPEHAARYRTNATALIDELNALDEEFRQGLAGAKKRTFVTSHAAFGYLAERYHLEQVSVRGVDPESDPSPAHLADLEETIEHEGVTTIFFERQASGKTARTLAEDLGLRTDVLDPLETVQDPERDTYFTVMRQNLRALRTALGAR